MTTHLTGSDRPTTQRTEQRCRWSNALALAVTALLFAAAVSGCSAGASEDPGPAPEPTWTPAPDPEPEPQADPDPEETPGQGADPQPGSESDPDVEEPEVNVPAPPPELVGRWNGGPGDSSDWYLTIRNDGSWTLINDYLGLTDSGQVDASGHGFVMYNDGGDASVVDAAGINGCSWSIEQGLGMTFLYFCDGPLSSWILAD